MWLSIVKHKLLDPHNRNTNILQSEGWQAGSVSVQAKSLGTYLGFYLKKNFLCVDMTICTLFFSLRTFKSS